MNWLSLSSPSTKEEASILDVGAPYECRFGSPGSIYGIHIGTIGDDIVARATFLFEDNSLEIHRWEDDGGAS